MASPPSPSVFDYLDYRAYLRDYYLERKRRRGLSYRGFSRRVGLKSSNFFKLVLDGERNLTGEMAVRFADAIGLSGDARDFFMELVRFDQARTTDSRNASYAKLTGYRRYRRARPLEIKHATYHSTWYLPAIRELAASPEFQEAPSWIAATLRPTISPSEAEKGLALLLDLGLLVREDDGTIRQGEPLVSTGPVAHRLHIVNYHRTMMQMAAQSLDEVAAAERDISSLTLCLNRDGLRRLKERLQRFRRELLDLSATESDPEQVVQVNLQLFPLSRVSKE